MALIRLLPPLVANQIAAGEVVERPASVVKELVENSLDAGAGHVRVRILRAGKSCIEVEDDGCGMSAADARMALQRHATSKIDSIEDLRAIASHGFRGEALPSIASVSRFRMHTAVEGEEEGTEVRVDQLGETACMPAPWRRGTRIEVRDLFLRTPARLRFMRADRTEEAAILDVVRHMAIARPDVRWQLWMDERSRLDAPAATLERRLRDVMGEDFTRNTVQQQVEHEGVIVRGVLGLPTYHHRDATRMLFFVNGRVIRDRPLIAALRAAYRDVMFHDRYPIAIVFLEMDPADVDVNVHPSKREVRFAHPQRVRAAVVACVRNALERHGQQVAAQTSERVLQAARVESSSPARVKAREDAVGVDPSISWAAGSMVQAKEPPPVWREKPAPCVRPAVASVFDGRSPSSSMAVVTPRRIFDAADQEERSLRLGVPLAQIHDRYILSQTHDGVLLIDQHAAHERIRYERMKQELREGGLREQRLLLPVPWQPEAQVAAWLHEHAEELQIFAVDITPEDDERFVVRGVPADLQDEPPQILAEELVDACRLIGSEAEAADGGMGRVLERWLGNRACKSALKAGQALSLEEQRELLRQMEQTPNIAQCNHGRPTYVRLSLQDLDRLFGRKA